LEVPGIRGLAFGGDDKLEACESYDKHPMLKKFIARNSIECEDVFASTRFGSDNG